MRDEAIKIVQRLNQSGFTALFAGGCVRDMVMGREPKDYDIATDASPEEVMRLFPKAIPFGVQFGVVTVILDGGGYEVARFRTDGPYRDGRHPDEVSFSTPREDALRRDFTINGMFYDPLKDEIIDYVGGQADIEAGVIRAIGDPVRRFGEDKLRMMRCVRFAAEFDYRIEAGTFAAVKRLAGGIVQVSAERVRDELVSVLTEGHARRGVELLIEGGLMEHILPEVCAMDGVEQPPPFHPEGDVLTHTLLMLERMGTTSPELAMGVLLHDVGKPPTFVRADRIRFDEHDRVGAEIAGEICTRLKFSNEQRDRIVMLVRDHMRFLNVRRMKLNTLKRFLRKEGFEDLLELYRLDCLCSHGDLTNWKFCVDALAQMGPEEIQPPPLINGHDLIALGYTPGPLFREILTFVENAQLDGVISDREEALKLVEERFRNRGGSR